MDNEIIDKINNDKYTEKELINLYNNAFNRNKQDIMKAVEIKMRTDFPRTATRMFGAKESKVREELESIHQKILSRYDLSKNQTKNKIKTGGIRISGKCYVDMYISYRNKDHNVVYLQFFQEKADSELLIRVVRYNTGKNKDQDTQENTFHIPDREQAVMCYQDYLSNIIDM
jgi:hypothetical protein